MNQSETIDALVNKREKLKSFESRFSKVLDQNPSFMEGIIKKRDPRGISEEHSYLNAEIQFSQE